MKVSWDVSIDQFKITVTEKDFECDGCHPPYRWCPKHFEKLQRLSAVELQGRDVFFEGEKAGGMHDRKA